MIEENCAPIYPDRLSQTGSQPGRARHGAASRVQIGSIAIDTYSEEVLVDHAVDHALQGCNTRQLATINAQFCVLAQKHRRFRECIGEADYICADGMPVVWTCNLFSGEYVPRITGIDLIDKLCRRGAAQGLRVFFLGGRPGAANITAEILSERYPGLQIAGTNCPEYGFERRPACLKAVLEHIARAKPQLIFVSMGAPRQELFIHQHIRALKVPLAVGIGGSFDILSGMISRAPRWMQQSGLEWAFRLSQEPQRLWRRYLIGNLEFLWLVAMWSLRNGLGAKPAKPGIRGSAPSNSAVDLAPVAYRETAT